MVKAFFLMIYSLLYKEEDSNLLIFHVIAVYSISLRQQLQDVGKKLVGAQHYNKEGSVSNRQDCFKFVSFFSFAMFSGLSISKCAYVRASFIGHTTFSSMLITSVFSSSFF